MDPGYRQWLRELIFQYGQHPLWRQAPQLPGATASAPIPPIFRRLVPVATTDFKKRGKGIKIPKCDPANIAAPCSSSSPGVEWPCQDDPPSPSIAEWPPWKNRPDPVVSLTPEDHNKWASKQAHDNALKAARDFFCTRSGDDDDEICVSSDDDDELIEDGGGRTEYSFFLKVFEDDLALKQYYERTFCKGEFNCLVCCSLGGKNACKKYRGCPALVQHSISVAKKRRAHRAFGQAVCKILGWDIDQLPSIVSRLSDDGETEENFNSKESTEVKEQEPAQENCSFRADSVVDDDSMEKHNGMVTALDVKEQGREV